MDNAARELEKALGGFLRNAPLRQMAEILAYASATGGISYDEAQKAIDGDDPEDALLIAYAQRMLIPVKSRKGTMEWDDAVLLCQPGEDYRMPNVIRGLVRQADKTGKWNPEQAVGQSLREMGETEWYRMSGLIRRLGETADPCRISADQIRQVCQEFKLEDRIDVIIAELKGSGVMSPKLGSMAERLTMRSPVYELNPSLFVGKGTDEDCLKEGLRDRRGVIESMPGTSADSVANAVEATPNRGTVRGLRQWMADKIGLALALSSRFPVEETSELASILFLARNRDIVSYEDIDLPSDLKDELLMLLHNGRLMISTTSSSGGGSSWKDRRLTFEPNERYQVPRVVRHLVQQAERSGEWNPRFAEEQCLREAGESRIADMIRFLAKLKMSASDFLMTPQIMQDTAATLRIELDLHQAIDELTRCGILSPPVHASLQLGFPQYEINRSLY